jgi:MFS transporter, FHS family, L-fucose permease
LETAANPFIAQLGPTASSERRLNFSQAFNPLGSITAGLIGTVFIFSGVELTMRRRRRCGGGDLCRLSAYGDAAGGAPYLVLGAVALLWALMVALTKFPDGGAEDVSREDAGPPRHVSLFQRHFVLAVLAQFLYVGAQVGTWSYFIPYVESATGSWRQGGGLHADGDAGGVCGGAVQLGVADEAFPCTDDAGSLFGGECGAGTGGGGAAELGGRVCLLTTSLFMSIMFPTIFALGLKGMGDKTKTAGSLLVMAILGGAALTKVMGMLADSSGLQAAYLVPVVCFAGCGAVCVVWRGAQERAS